MDVEEVVVPVVHRGEGSASSPKPGEVSAMLSLLSIHIALFKSQERLDLARELWCER